MSDWEDFLRPDNLGFAWRRVVRSKHFHNKDRVGLRVFGSNLDANLSHLVSVLSERVYEPRPCEKMYLPKRAGTVRSLPILAIADRVVYQAIVNVVASKSKAGFEALTEGHVFAHLLNELDDPFFVRRWEGANGQYSKFLAKFRKLYARGNRWVIEADIASYYDGIDHELLCRCLGEQWSIADGLLSLLMHCLRVWTPHEYGANFSRGLPQGYEASDYLATLFLFDTDSQSIRKKYNYIRYVDDIRILAPERDDANVALLHLDIFLKKQALILQPKKTGAREIQDIDDEIDKLVGTLSGIDQRMQQGQDVENDAENMLLNAWKTLDDDPRAEAHLVFALNRMKPTETGRRIALDLLGAMPWRSHVITGYLSRFVGDAIVISALLAELKSHKVYAWHLANCLRALAAISDPETYRDLAFEWISRKDLRWYQRMAAVESLQHDAESYGPLFFSFKSEENYLVRRAMLIAAAFGAETSDQLAVIIRYGMRDVSPDVVAASLWLLTTFPFCDVTVDEFEPFVKAHKTFIPPASSMLTKGVSLIERKLVSIFGVNIPPDFDFRTALGSGYETAFVALERASSYRETDATAFVTNLDSFNQVLAIRANEVMAIRPGIPKDDYSNLLKALLNSQFASMAVHFAECHALRSRSPGAHAWATSLGTWAQAVTHPEKERLIANLRPAYQQFVDLFAVQQGIRIT